VEHKQLTLEQIKEIERESGATIPDSDFHSFIAHERSRRATGAATISEVRERGSRFRLLMIVTPVIRIKKITALEESSDSVGRTFLDQFAGKDSKAPLRIGQDLKYDGPNPQEAMAAARAIKRDLLAMQALYGRL
jgi:phosphopantetheine adenylyltransferase